jgi:hypothetical protein
MDFSSLILMERDSETGFVTKEVGSFQVSEGAVYVKKFYIKGEKIYLTFDTNKDVEEWEYSAVYDMFNYGVFEEEGFEIEDVEDEYNPTFLVKFKYIDDYDYIRERLEHCIDIIVESMEKVFGDIEGKKEEYI